MRIVDVAPGMITRKARHKYHLVLIFIYLGLFFFIDSKFSWAPPASWQGLFGTPYDPTLYH
jgi:hypothetical protein